MDGDPIDSLKRKLRSLSYGASGQDPRKLFSHYDRDNSGRLDFAEFSQLLSRSPSSPSEVSETESGVARALFVSHTS